MNRLKATSCICLVLCGSLASAGPAAAAADRRLAGEPVAEHDSIERGRYVVKIGGCNDCHTPGYVQANGAVPEATWLIGDTLGYRGPWGTSTPATCAFSSTS